jgi:hypothetical protein
MRWDLDLNMCDLVQWMGLRWIEPPNIGGIALAGEFDLARFM